MKKIMIFLMMLTCIGCREYIVRDEFPQAIMGTLPNGLTIVQAENVISSMAILQKWNITDRAEGWMKIYKTVDFYDLHGSITYNENNYTISMDSITSPKREEYEVNRSPYVTEGVMGPSERIAYDNARYKLFNKHASKLSRAIQKQSMKNIRAQNNPMYQQNGTAPIIINNNISR